MKTQALGWLATAVVAAGLNASYHEGGMEWAHRIADEVGGQTSAVVALATGRADRFLAEAQGEEAQVAVAQVEEAQMAEAQVADSQQSVVSSCPLSAALARARAKFAESQMRFEDMSSRQEAQMARLEARRARIEAQVARIRIPAVSVNPVVARVQKVACPRIRMNVLRMPAIRVPATPVIHVDVSGAGPV